MTTLKLQSKPRSYKARQAVIDAIRERVPFETSGSLSGEDMGNRGGGTSGRLEGPDRDAFNRQHRHITYVVRSYVTPIAWYSPLFGWHIVEQTFSVTTGSQQSIVRQALDGRTNREMLDDITS